jgi:hypothetical protein
MTALYSLDANILASHLKASPGRKWFNGNRNQPNYLSTMDRGKVEIGAEILLRISPEFGKSIEWLLTG